MHLPRVEGTKAIEWLALVKAAKPVAETVKALAEAASTLWKTWREGRELERQALRGRLRSQGAGSRLRFGWARRCSMSRITASLTMVSETSGSSS